VQSDTTTLAGMNNLELIELYVSPWSERVRWALDLKGLPFARREYRPLVDEDELRRTTGIATTPVLLADGQVVGDSDAALEWIESAQPTPALLPPDARERAAVRAYELMATETLAPFGRLVLIGRWQTAGVQPIGDHFAAKYHWSPDAEARGVAVLRTLLPELARAVATGPYLVGNTFTRADLTLSCMLTPVLGAPPDDLFALDAGTRGMFGILLAQDPALAPLRAWRDATYRRHRGGRVVPNRT